MLVEEETSCQERNLGLATREEEEDENGRNELATRYIRVHEVPKTSTELDLENLFIVRPYFPSLSKTY